MVGSSVVVTRPDYASPGGPREDVASWRRDFGVRLHDRRICLRASARACERVAVAPCDDTVDQPAVAGGDARGFSARRNVQSASADQRQHREAGATAQSQPEARQSGDQSSGRTTCPRRAARSPQASRTGETCSTVAAGATGATGTGFRRAECRRRSASAAEPREPDVGDRRRSQRASGHPPGRDPRSRARPVGDAAQRRRQGQPVFPARLQSRPRHRHRDLGRRHADQPAHPCPWPGLRRPQLPHAGGRQFARHPQGAVLCRRRRFRQCRLARDRPAGHGAAHGRFHHRQLRLRAPVRDRLDQALRGQPARRCGGCDLQRAVGQSRRHAQVQRNDALQPGHRHRRRVGDRDGLFQQVEFVRPGAAARDRIGRHSALRRARPLRRRRHDALLALGAGRAVGRLRDRGRPTAT